MRAVFTSEVGETIKKNVSINVLDQVETMVANDEISAALKSAMVHLKDSILSTDNEDKRAVEDDIWYLAAELEHTLFLFSMTIKEEIDKSKWRLNPKTKRAEFKSVLSRVKGLLTEAEGNVKKGKLLDAYKSAYLARSSVLVLQKEFDKRRREALKKKR